MVSIVFDVDQTLDCSWDDMRCRVAITIRSGVSPPRLHILPVPILRLCLGPRGRVAHGDGIEIPDIQPHIHRIAATPPVAVDVAEEVERTFAGVVPGDHRVVAEGHWLVGRGVVDLDQQRDAVLGQPLRQVTVMVAHQKVPTRTGQLGEDAKQPVLVFRLGAQGKVANDPEVILRADALPQPFDQDSRHLVDVPERAAGIWDDAFMAEMRIGGVPVGHRNGS